MIKILQDLKKSNPKMYQKVLRDLDVYGERVSNHYIKLTYPNFLDLVSYCNSYTFSPDATEPSILDELNRAEHDMFTRVRKSNGSDHKSIQDVLSLANNRCRQKSLKLIENYSSSKNDSVTFLSSLKQKVFG